MGRILPIVLLLVLAAQAAFAATGFEREAAPPSLLLSGPTLATSSISAFSDDSTRARRSRRGHKPARAERTRGDATVFGAQRAAILLRSLTVPGWGQASLGRRHSAAFFGTAELGIWTAFTAFRVQEVMRANSYARTARLFAGIDVRGRDEEFRRIVGAFASSDEYNLLVVARDAANLYMQDVYHPDMDGYWAYIAAHSLTGADAWQWTDEQSFRRYGDQRKQAHRAAIRANTAMAVAIVNRLASAVHAARGARPAAAGTGHTSWNVGFAPGQPGERVLFRTGLTARF